MRALRALRKPLKAMPEAGGNGIKGNAIASRTAAYGRACYTWAIKHQLVKANPFAAVPLNDFKTSARDRVLTDGELVAIWRAAEFHRCQRIRLACPTSHPHRSASGGGGRDSVARTLDRPADVDHPGQQDQER